MFEGVNWVFGGGFQGGVNAKDDADNKSGEESDKDDFPTNEGGKRSNDGNKEGETIAEDEAKNTTQKREDQRFEEKLH